MFRGVGLFEFCRIPFSLAVLKLDRKTLLLGEDGILYAMSKQYRRNFSRWIFRFSSAAHSTAPEDSMKFIQSDSVSSVTLRDSGDDDPSTSNDLAIVIASA